MSISYAFDISTASWCNTLRLLKYWRGSVYKLLWRELLTFLMLFYAVNFVYRFTLDPMQKEIAFTINTHIRGSSDMAKAIRRTAIRYANLCALLGLRLCSTAVHKRYPTMQHVIAAGFMREDELQKFESIATNYPKEYIPCVWATALYRHALKEKFISDPRSLNELYKETNDFRQTVRSSRFFGWISVPLIYTQEFGPTALDNQTALGDLSDNVSSSVFTLEVYFPLFTILELMIYMGWLKAAEVMMNPFGEDDDDFEMDFVLERNLEVAYVIADDLADEDSFPKLDIEAQAKRINVAARIPQQRRMSFYGGSAHPGSDRYVGSLVTKPTLRSRLKDWIQSHLTMDTRLKAANEALP